ncbi:MAG: hypothetical protein KBT40_02735 [bacterium]|nr:hypothetical protein [Candidatus Minthenecus merdequi]
MLRIDSQLTNHLTLHSLARVFQADALYQRHTVSAWRAVPCSDNDAHIQGSGFQPPARQRVHSSWHILFASLRVCTQLLRYWLPARTELAKLE